jgi:hypothetical protein
MAFRLRVLAGILVLVGCSSPPAPPPPKTTPVAAAATPEATPAEASMPQAEVEPDATDSWPIPKPEVSRVPVAPERVTLETPGAEPRSVLRFSPQIGASRTVELGMSMQVSMTVGSKTIDPSVLPEVTVQMNVTATPAKDDGATLYAYTVSSATREPLEGASERLKKAMDTAVEGMKDTRGSLTIDARGRRLAAQYSLPEIPTPDLRPSLAGFQQSFSQLFVVLPQEAVGVGGSWSSTSHFELSGIPIEQRSTYTMTSKDGDTLTLSVVFEQSATGPAQAPAGVALEDTQFGGRGSGTLHVKLDSPFPLDAQAQSRSRVQSSVAMGGVPQPVEMDLLSSLAITAPAG